MQEEIIYRYLVGKCSREEENAIGEWYARNPEENQRTIDRVRFLFESSLIHHTIGKPVARAPKLRASRQLVKRMVGVAAVIALMVGSMYGARELAFREMSTRMMAFEVPAGQRIDMDLADGTHVWLNSGSKIEYPALFDRRCRRVKIEGEAMFDVAQEADRPFIVETYASKIEVLGTKFNVEADEAANRFSTALIRGKVKVSIPGQTIYLSPEQTVDLVNGDLVVTRTEDAATLLWTEGILSMRGVSFEELMAKFERLYDVKIVCECEAMPVIEFSSGKIRIADGIDHALKVLQHVAKFTYQHDEESNIIFIK